ncbi:hypothetical protein PspLS_02577 [Pyricularia sp. CBS 133598]|nr:hypothetical protein PspLS_02577 [Pyricularia sp. CBS 133598]
MAPCVPVPQENPGAAAHFDARIWAVQCCKLGPMYVSRNGTNLHT